MTAAKEKEGEKQCSIQGLLGGYTHSRIILGPGGKGRVTAVTNYKEHGKGKRFYLQKKQATGIRKKKEKKGNKMKETPKQHLEAQRGLRTPKRSRPWEEVPQVSDGVHLILDLTFEEANALEPSNKRVIGPRDPPHCSPSPPTPYSHQPHSGRTTKRLSQTDGGRPPRGRTARRGLQQQLARD